jgi:transposase
MNEQNYFDGMDATTAAGKAVCGDATPQAQRGAARLRRADRTQVRMVACCLDELIGAEHPARLLWEAVGRLDLSGFESSIAARGDSPGRSATDPRVLVTLWLYATVEGVGEGREVARLCESHDAYRWIAGGVSLNYHTINDFRVAHESALDDLFTQVLAVLMGHGLVEVNRIAQDGVRVRASAGSSSFRRGATLEALEQAARAQVEAVKGQNDPAVCARRRARQEAAAADRQARVTAALAELPKVEATRRRTANRKDRADKPPRVSTTDPDARVMKMADGGYRPAYNVQLAADPSGRAIVGVAVTNDGRDNEHSEPMRQQVERRTGRSVREHLYDGGFISLDRIDRAEGAAVAVYAPVPLKSADPHARKRDDTDRTFAWRQRMATDEAKAIYKTRAATIETINGDLTEHRGLRRFRVRGLPRVRCVVLWAALVYNVMLWIKRAPS